MRCQHCECQARRESGRINFPVMHAIVWRGCFKAAGLPGWLGVAASVTMTTVLPMAVMIAFFEWLY